MSKMCYSSNTVDTISKLEKRTEKVRFSSSKLVSTVLDEWLFLDTIMTQ